VYINKDFSTPSGWILTKSAGQAKDNWLFLHGFKIIPDIKTAHRLPAAHPVFLIPSSP